MDPVRDGHKLTVALGVGYTLDLDVECPGDCDLWDPANAREREKEPCWVRYMVREFGSEFLEWWEDGGPRRVTLTDGPVEFEWWVDGGEEGEVRWRPITACREPTATPALTTDERAELHALRDLRQRVIDHDGHDFTVVPWIDAHRHHADEPYIGCVFCRDEFVRRDVIDGLVNERTALREFVSIIEADACYFVGNPEEGERRAAEALGTCHNTRRGTTSVRLFREEDVRSLWEAARGDKHREPRGAFRSHEARTAWMRDVTAAANAFPAPEAWTATTSREQQR